MSRRPLVRRFHALFEQSPFGLLWFFFSIPAPAPARAARAILFLPFLFLTNSRVFHDGGFLNGARRGPSGAGFLV